MGNIHENRLADSDRERIRKTVRETLALWNASGGPREHGADTLTLQRIAYHSIGCSAYDLRECELQEINGMVETLIHAEV